MEMTQVDRASFRSQPNSCFRYVSRLFQSLTPVMENKNSLTFWCKSRWLGNLILNISKRKTTYILDFPDPSSSRQCHLKTVSANQEQTIKSCVAELLSHLQLFAIPWTASSPGVCSNSCPSSRWCHPTISSSVVPFSSCPQSFPASGSFPMSQLFASGGQSTGASPSASVLPTNIQDWLPLGLAGWISLQSKGLSRVLQHHSSKASSSSTLGILYGPVLTSIRDYWKNHSFDYKYLCRQSNVSAF